LREKDESLVNLQTIPNRPLIKLLTGNQIVQRGNRIIDNDIIFATSFSDLFQVKINSKILSIDSSFNITF
jgi:lipopolysaccharide biosynthesis glycosyltransferase